MAPRAIWVLLNNRAHQVRSGIDLNDNFTIRYRSNDSSEVLKSPLVNVRIWRLILTCVKAA
jgi:hypothetical protein